MEDFADQSGLLNSFYDESDIKQLVLWEPVLLKKRRWKIWLVFTRTAIWRVSKNAERHGQQYQRRDAYQTKPENGFRMDSLARLRTMVFAVGAAHLPGEEGLISLLKKKGFSVEPVFYSKKIKPENYSVPEIEKPWVQVNDPEGHYKVQMPGTPGDIKFYGVMTMSMYFNIFNSTWYMSATASLPYAQKGLDSVKKVILKQLFGLKGYKEENPVEINGIPGKSYVQKDAEGLRNCTSCIKTICSIMLSHSLHQTPLLH